MNTEAVSSCHGIKTIVDAILDPDCQVSAHVFSFLFVRFYLLFLILTFSFSRIYASLFDFAFFLFCSTLFLFLFLTFLFPSSASSCLRSLFFIREFLTQLSEARVITAFWNLYAPGERFAHCQDEIAVVRFSASICE